MNNIDGNVAKRFVFNFLFTHFTYHVVHLNKQHNFTNIIYQLISYNKYFYFGNQLNLTRVSLICLKIIYSLDALDALDIHQTGILRK